MAYSFQVVPIERFKLLNAELDRLVAPIERYQALRVGACSILLLEVSEECLNGIGEEKRRLASWVRNQRSSVRYVRYKGASKMRGALNADISNASDSARSQLDWLRSAAEYARQKSDARLKESLAHVSLGEAEEYKASFQAELSLRVSSESSKSLLKGLLIVGGIAVFLLPPLGVALLVIALGVYLVNREQWQRLDRAEADRALQLNEIRQQRAELNEFDAQLVEAGSVKADAKDPASVAGIREDLQSRYLYLDIACRELGSSALTWDQLAEQLYEQMDASGPDDLQDSSTPADQAYVSGVQQSDTSEVNDNLPNNPEHSVVGTISPAANPFSLDLITKDVDDYYFSVDLEMARLIMSCLGYKRLPSEWLNISIKAEERISRYLADRAGIDYDEFYWNFDEGNIKAEAL